MWLLSAHDARGTHMALAWHRTLLSHMPHVAGWTGRQSVDDSSVGVRHSYSSQLEGVGHVTQGHWFSYLAAIMCHCWQHVGSYVGLHCDLQPAESCPQGSVSEGSEPAIAMCVYLLNSGVVLWCSRVWVCTLVTHAMPLVNEISLRDQWWCCWGWRGQQCPSAP